MKSIMPSIILLLLLTLTSCQGRGKGSIPDYPTRAHIFEEGVEGRERCLDKENASLYAERELALKKYHAAVEESCF